jgi:hypothetical protein
MFSTCRKLLHFGAGRRGLRGLKNYGKIPKDAAGEAHGWQSDEAADTKHGWHRR